VILKNILLKPDEILQEIQISYGLIASKEDEDLLIDLYDLVHTSNIEVFFKKHFILDNYCPVGINISDEFANEVICLTRTQFKKQVQLSMIIELIENSHLGFPIHTYLLEGEKKFFYKGSTSPV
jgi:hypothetical protein